MQLTKQQKTQLAITLKRNPDVIAAFLFGSQIRGTTGPLSDVDIGLLVHPDISSTRRARLMKTLFIDCALLLNTDHIDLIDLLDAPPALRYRILTENEPLFLKDRRTFYRFHYQTIQAYEDFRPHLEAQANMIRKKIAAYVST